MQLKQLTSNHFVSDQLLEENFEALASQGIKSIINNRPDAESPDHPDSQTLERLAKSAGLAYVYAPITTQTLTADELTTNRQAFDKLDKPICAFCRTGARAAITWGLLSTADSKTTFIIETVAKANLPIAALLKQLSCKKSTEELA